MQFNIKKIVAAVIFNSKWLLIPFLFKLIWTLIKLIPHTYHGHVKGEEIIAILEDVDIAMIAGLIITIIMGSYHSFVDKNHGYDNEKITSGFLKVKLGTSLIGVSSVLMLQILIESTKTNISMNTVYIMIMLHMAFIIGAVALAYIDFIHSKTIPHIEPNHLEPNKTEHQSIH